MYTYFVTPYQIHQYESHHINPLLSDVPMLITQPCNNWYADLSVHSFGNLALKVAIYGQRRL